MFQGLQKYVWKDVMHTVAIANKIYHFYSKKKYKNNPLSFYCNPGSAPLPKTFFFQGTKSSDLKQLSIRKYQQRLRKRHPDPHIKERMKIKEENALRVIEIERGVKHKTSQKMILQNFLKN